LLLGGIFFVGLLFLAILFNGYLFKIQNSLFNIQHSKMVNRRTTNNELAKAQRRKSLFGFATDLTDWADF
jgi:hypothetical protein